jgi:hypothetical protein
MSKKVVKMEQAKKCKKKEGQPKKNKKIKVAPVGAAA